jgi:anthranilate synthase component I
MKREDIFVFLFNRGGTAVFNRPLQTQQVCVCRGFLFWKKYRRFNMSKSYKVVVEKNETVTPVDVYERLQGKKKFLLESTFQHETKGTFSFIGTNPYLEMMGCGNETILQYPDGHIERIQENALSFLKKHFPKIEVNLPVPFYGGAVGYVSYDMIRQFEKIGHEQPDEIDMPDLHFMLYQSIIAFNHETNEIYFIAITFENEPEHVLDSRLEDLQSVLSTQSSYKKKDSCLIDFQLTMTEQAFKEKVEKAKHYIEKGDAFQVVLSQRMKGSLKGNPFAFYLKLREANPSPYMFYIDFEDYQLLGASPESLVQTINREIITNPIAGTRPRGKTKQEDEMLEKELLADEKEIAEHKMLVDLSRNDLGRVCEIGSIYMPKFMKIEKYQHVMHIVSEVKGRLRNDFTSIDALIACLPAGTVSGAPKIRAMQIINELEEQKRGVYAGGIGFINWNFDLNFALAIRTLVVKDGFAYLQAGAGIVYDSVPELEYKETINKARSLMEVAKGVPVNR